MNSNHQISTYLTASIIGLTMSVLSWPCLAGASAISGQGTWESTLQARDLDGDLSTTEAFYDKTLNITWLADAALSLTESYGVTDILKNGRLPDWDATNDWISGMNAGDGHLGQTNWRLPIILDASDVDAIQAPNNDPSRSELSHLFYVTLGNVANKDKNGNINPNPGLANTALFSNFQAYYYWTSTESSNTNAWTFAMHNGDQYRRAKIANGYPLPVLDGDVGEAITDKAIDTGSAENGSFSVERSANNTSQNEDFTYSFCFENKNAQDTTVQIESDIPTGTAFVSATGSYSTTSSAVIWSIDFVQANAPRQCVQMVVNVQAEAGSTLIENTTIQSDQTFIPAQLKTTTDVIAKTTTGNLSSDKGGGFFGLLEMFVFLLALTFRSGRISIS